jgi:hypothetical protein
MGTMIFGAIRVNNNDVGSNLGTFAWKRVSKYIYDIKGKEGFIQKIQRIVPEDN